jgi:hypothetical protein
MQKAATAPEAGARAERFALADMEVRYDWSVPREAVTWVADLSEWLGDEHAFDRRSTPSGRLRPPGRTDKNLCRCFRVPRLAGFSLITPLIT